MLGIGTSLGPTLIGGDFKNFKRFSATRDTISEPMPYSLHPLSIVNKRPVFETDFRIILSSSGRILRRSITSAFIPHFARMDAHRNGTRLHGGQYAFMLTKKMANKGAADDADVLPQVP